jgi:plastocyanin
VAAGTVHVVMQTLSFVPGSVDAKVGQRVLWTNQDTSPHNVLYVSGPRFASSGILQPGQKFGVRLTQPGTIHYYCSIHPWMKATVVVSR